MKPVMIFAYGLLSYALFFVTFLYSIGFLGNLWVPKSIDSQPTVSLTVALLTDLGLLTLFAVQHSGMARPAFKQWLTRFIPKPAERSTYVLMSTLCLALMMYYWAPLGGTLWQATSNIAVWTLHGLYLTSWALLLYATFLINHFDLFGLRQVYLALRKQPEKPLRFVTPALYRIVRHPIYVGWLGIVWFTPTMTATHALFALGATAYIFLGIKLEERDLEAAHPEYAQYKRKVPALIPNASRKLRRSDKLTAAQ
ncbi:isoprenylcysteine carboxylmethyltransferase family protein [Alteromonas aestuariivivens]|uniref:methanethiol S-methyltransferase n=1 Tax=Alteromonas aestuariivivens TaxID=1938339 RepID=A0A3D8M9L5_9ALTE|nr:methanethiol S-methyltransferase [Alteromonas aestuariivivens]RDV26733.1 isoprenylcysteine carboxylmethyltransferase family protein [Alteromonas aestuariivivens]